MRPLLHPTPSSGLKRRPQRLLMIDLKNIKAVIIDFDGTLYDSKGFTKKFLKTLGFSSLLKARNERKLRSLYKGKYFGTGEEFYFSYFQELARLCHTSPKKISDWYFKKYMGAMTKTLEKHFNCRPGTEKLFAFLKEKNIKTAVFSDYAFVPQRMKAIGLEGVSDFLFSAEILGGLKPACEPFFKIARVLGEKPENILVIGDRPDTDGRGALNSCMKSLIVKTEKKSNQNLENIFTWEEILSIIFSETGL